MHKLITQHSFATLISNGTSEPEISHTPMLIDKKKTVLRGHLSKANQHYKGLLKAEKALAVFHGPHHYISPSSYKNHPSVPTWNYAVVHVSGKASVISNRSTILKFLSDLVKNHESSEANPWKFELPTAYLEKMVKSVVYFEIAIEEVSAKFKLSQNRPKDDLPIIIDHLRSLQNENSIDIANLMVDNVLKKNDL